MGKTKFSMASCLNISQQNSSVSLSNISIASYINDISVSHNKSVLKISKLLKMRATSNIDDISPLKRVVQMYKLKEKKPFERLL